MQNVAIIFTKVCLIFFLLTLASTNSSAQEITMFPGVFGAKYSVDGAGYEYTSPLDQSQKARSRGMGLWCSRNWDTFVVHGQWL
jgi:hypothetical protein